MRDVRGFATRFYTDEGNWDLGKYWLVLGMTAHAYSLLTVGNNIPVFFIQVSLVWIA